MPRPAGKASQAGMTLVEILFALALLGLGVGMLWYMLSSAKRLEGRTRARALALELAQSEMELLRARNPEAATDSVYASGPEGGMRFQVEREVLHNSEDVDGMEGIAAFRPLALGEGAPPPGFSPPTEVRIRVWRLHPDPFRGETRIGEALASFSAFLPGYQWH